MALSNFDENFGMAMDFDSIRRQFREWVAQQPTVEKLESLESPISDRFQVTIDVYQFESDEIVIKAVGSSTISIEAHHEERQGDFGFVSRNFARRYTVPSGYDIKNVVSTLSADGLLRIIAPRVGQSIDYQKEIRRNSRDDVRASNATQTVRRNSQEVPNGSHDYIREFLSNVEKYRTVPVRQVGPFSQTNSVRERSFEEDKRNVRQTSVREESVSQSQSQYRNVPITQTESRIREVNVGERQSRSVAIEQTGFKSVRGEEEKRQITQTSTDTETDKTQNLRQIHKRENSSEEENSRYQNVPITEMHDIEEQNVQVDCGTQKTVPIERTEYYKQSQQQTNVQRSTTEIHGSKEEYRNVPVTQTHRSVDGKYKQQTNVQVDNNAQKCRTIPIEQTGNYKQTQRESNVQSNTTQYRNVPITETYRSADEKYEQQQTNVQVDNAQNCRTIPIEQKENYEQQTNVRGDTTQTYSFEGENSTQYRNVPITQTHRIVDEKYEQQTSVQVDNAQKCRTIPIEQTDNYKQQNVQSNLLKEETGTQYRNVPITHTETQFENNKCTELQYQNVPMNTESNRINTNNVEKREFNSRNVQETHSDCHKQTGTQVSDKTYKRIDSLRDTTENKTTETNRHDTIIPVQIENRNTTHETENNLNRTSKNIDNLEISNQESTCTQIWHKSTQNQSENTRKIDNLNRTTKMEELDATETAQSSHDQHSTVKNKLTHKTNLDIDHEIAIHKAQVQKRNSIETHCNCKTFANNSTETRSSHVENRESYRSTNGSVSEQVDKQETNLNNSQLSHESLNNNLLFRESDSSKEDFVKDGYRHTGRANKNARAEFMAYPDGYKATNEQSYYTEQTVTKENGNERYSRTPSQMSEICIEEITEENETKRA